MGKCTVCFEDHAVSLPSLKHREVAFNGKDSKMS